MRSKAFVIAALAALAVALPMRAQDGGGGEARPTFDWTQFVPGDTSVDPVTGSFNSSLYPDGVRFGYDPETGETLTVPDVSGDPWMGPIVEAMIGNAKTQNQLDELQTMYEAAIEQIDKVMKDLAEHSVTVVGESGGSSGSTHGLSIPLSHTGVDTVEDMDFDTSSATLTLTPKKAILKMGGTWQSELGITSDGDATPLTATFAKIAGSNKITDADDWETEKSAIETAYTEADAKVTEDLTNLILSYHPPEEGVPDEATNILAQVAFDGDYNSLTNKPSIKVEEDEDGNITLTLVTGEDADGSMDLHTIAVSGLLSDAEDWDDLDDRITALEDHVASCQCNGGGEGGGGGEGCTCEGCGGGGCTCAAEEKQCDCQIKTAAHVNAAEVDPEAIPRVEALESRMTKVENDLATASQRLNALCEYLGKNPMPGDMNRPPDFDN